uniref:Uncharacterized protein n=1 Tax=Anguilla anguilla TaxID=7936 RepID=A0A0E9R662_ANGAN
MRDSSVLQFHFWTRRLRQKQVLKRTLVTLTTASLLEERYTED